MADIKVNPEGWGDMVAKYEAREKAEKKRAMQKLKVEHPEAMGEASKKALANKDQRTTDRIPLKNREVKVNPESAKVLEEKNKQSAQIQKTNEVFVQKLGHTVEGKEPPSLHGRVSS